MIEQSRRGFITGLISFAVTAPAIVRATSLMPVKLMEPLVPIGINHFIIMCPEQYEQLLRVRVAAAEQIMTENVKTIFFGGRFYGISGKSNNIYYSDPVGNDET
jgi:hypothetical protein